MRSIEHIDEGPPARAAQTLLFLHGLSGMAESWRPQIAALAPMVRCVAWTMPGYGRSRALPQTTIASLADAAADLLDGLDIAKAVVVGHSMGGFVAQELALRHPEQVERLVLVATTAVFGKGPGTDYNKGVLAARLTPLDEGRRMPVVARAHIPTLVGPHCPPEVVTAAIKLMGAIPPAGYRAALEALVDWDGREHLGSLRLPTLCLAGDLDTTAPSAEVAALAALIPDSRVETIAGAGHLLNQEQPEETNRLIRSFLAWM